MPKRKNRVKPLTHEMNQLENLKTLEPITTPDEWRSFSESLLDIAIAAIDLARRLEAGRLPSHQRMKAMVLLVNELPDLAPPKDDEDGDG
jgi:hypothetical protein